MGAVEAVWGWAPGPQGTLHGWCCPGWAGRGWRCWRPGRGASPVHDEGGGIVAHGGRVQRPPAAGQLAGLDGVVAYGGQPIAARLPGQQHAARLHVLLLNHRLAGGLRAVWGGAEQGGAGEQAVGMRDVLSRPPPRPIPLPRPEDQTVSTVSTTEPPWARGGLGVCEFTPPRPTRADSERCGRRLLCPVSARGCDGT